MSVRRGVRPLALVTLLAALMADCRRHAVGRCRLRGHGHGRTVEAVRAAESGAELNKDHHLFPNGGAYITFVSNEGPAVVFRISDGLVESATMLGTVNHPGRTRGSSRRSTRTSR